LALAVAIALTEYVMYSPSIIPEVLDEDLFTKDSGVIDAPEEQYSVPKDLASSESERDDADTTEKVDTQIGATPIPHADAAPELPFSESKEHTVVIKSGDTLGSVLSGLGFGKTEVYQASSALSKIFNLRNLKVGQEVIVKGERGADGDLILLGLEIRPDYRFRIVVEKKGESFTARKVDVPVKSVIRNISGTMDPASIHYSLKQCGVQGKVASEAVRVLNQVVNLRDAKRPIDFEFLCEYFYDNDGHMVSTPGLLYVSVLHNGRIVRLYKFKDKDNTCEYVDSNGMILSTIARTGSMLARPLSSMKVTSGFGLRIHPISGRLKGHTGIDLSARVGTPIRAAASGVIVRASNYFGYGKYVKIKHTETVSTAYGHMSRIAVRSGQQVYQGQIIGYTGDTGYSNGPHLHYEVLRNGRPVNPLAFVKYEPHKLSGSKLTRFNRFKSNVNLQIVGLTQSSGKVVSRSKKYS
jgi:murein DD-endopeptidase MepM/ murein hydrolase activator NlpD